jgi:hypothetical protein
MLISALLVLIVGGVRALGAFMPNRRRLPGRGNAPQGGW